MDRRETMEARARARVQEVGDLDIELWDLDLSQHVMTASLTEEWSAHELFAFVRWVCAEEAY